VTNIPDESFRFLQLENAFGKSWERVPSDGYLAQLFGVPTFYALLAYPSQRELLRREEFRDALRADMLKAAIAVGSKRSQIPERYRRFKNEKICGVIRRGFRRISRRLTAGSMGYCICLALCVTRKEGETLQVPSTVNKAAGAVCVDKAMKTKKINLKLDLGTEGVNIKHRVWAESLSVLHMAIALYPLAVRGGSAFS
jgi:hypothetical protein